MAGTRIMMVLNIMIANLALLITLKAMMLMAEFIIIIFFLLLPSHPE